MQNEKEISFFWSNDFKPWWRMNERQSLRLCRKLQVIQHQKLHPDKRHLTVNFFVGQCVLHGASPNCTNIFVLWTGKKRKWFLKLNSRHTLISSDGISFLTFTMSGVVVVAMITFDACLFYQLLFWSHNQLNRKIHCFVTDDIEEELWF